MTAGQRRGPSVGRSTLIDIAVGAVLVGAVPVRRVTAIHQGFGIRAVALAALVLVACSILVALFRRRPGNLAVTAAFIAAVAGLGAVAGGRTLGVILVVTAALGAWVGMGREAPVLGEFRPADRIPVIAPMLLGAFAAGKVDRFNLALFWVLVSVVLSLVCWRWPELPAKVAEPVSHAVGVALRTLLLFPLWLATALIPWALQRVTRVDVLAPDGAADRGWIQRGSVPVDRRALWLDERPVRRSLARRAHLRAPFWLGFAIAAVLATGVIYVTVLQPLRSPPPANEAEANLRNQVDSAQVLKDTDGALAEIWFSQWAGNEWSDYSSETVNIADGRRRSWFDTHCTARPLVIWMFGGSASFGVYQHDDRTIASEMARQASRRGIRLEVQNWGMPGDVGWIQARRLERALMDAQPDMVVFYDGWNDLRVVQDTSSVGREGVGTDFTGPLDRMQMPILGELGGIDQGTWRLIEVPPAIEPRSSEDAIDLAARSYGRAQETAERLTATAGLPFFRFAQPSVLSRSEVIRGEVEVDQATRDREAQFRRRLPPDVIDLGAALDDLDEPVFYDEVHTTEAANPVIAAAVLDEMWPAIEATAAEKGVGTCR